ncbi:MAG: cytochrome c biogenesis protein CcdA, partial [Planctomycetota bacterium]
VAGDESDDSPEFVFSGHYTIDQGKKTGSLNVVLDIKKDWHGYSQKQLSGQEPTVLDVQPSKEFKVTGPFAPDKQPKKKKIDLGNGNQGDVEEFEGRVTWTAPIEVGEGVDPTNLVINVNASGQVCKVSCIPFFGDRAKVAARFSHFRQSVDAFYSDHATLTGVLSHQAIKPGEKTKLQFEANINPGWHIYKLEEFQREGTTAQPTILYFTKTSGFKIGEPQPSKEAIKHKADSKDESEGSGIYFYKDKVQWDLEIEVPTETKEGNYFLEGKLLFQVCSDDHCDPPTSLDFKVPVKVAASSSAQEVPVEFSINNGDREQLMAASKSFWEEQRLESGIAPAIPLSELAAYLMLAFGAGLILNAMPCVLPVIGLKVMSFVQQAGEQRGRIFLLNLVFSFGLLVVFWILATLSAFFGFGWGDWLTKSLTGAIVMTAVVFAFGLSMLGVWEIPIPGLSGSSSISKKSEEEGLLGAFFLGILTTILATPCTGPMLIPALAVTAGQPPWVAYLIFTTIGLGMALPYLLVGIFPSLISWLPRPGAWMNTFKQITGFVLMATVVFMMSSFSSEPRNEYLVAMMSLLLSIAFGCWWIGQTSLAAESWQQLRAWGAGVAIILVGGLVSFTYFGPTPYELDWQQFSKNRLEELIDEDRLVFIDFTGPL